MKLLTFKGKKNSEHFSVTILPNEIFLMDYKKTHWIIFKINPEENCILDEDLEEFKKRWACCLES